jgi:adenine phosphoribosyltransferase
VVLVDDVMSTGSTLHGMRLLMDQVGAEVAAEATILTEGDPNQWTNVISLGHLPLFKD